MKKHQLTHNYCSLLDFLQEDFKALGSVNDSAAWETVFRIDLPYAQKIGAIGLQDVIKTAILHRPEE